MSTQMLKEAERRFPGGGIQMFTGRAASLREVRERGADFASVPFINPANHRILRRRAERYNETRVDWQNDSEHRRAYSALVRASLHSAEAQQDLASFRQFELVHNINASPFALAAFQSVNLSADEIPMMIFPRGRHAQRFAVRSESLNGGGSESDQWRTSRDAETIEMEYIATDKVEYPLIDLQTGNISEEANILAELAYDLDMKIDASALAQIDAAETTSGLRDLMSIHSLVDQTNIPDSNYLDLTDVPTYGTANKLTLPRLKAILNHIVLVGAADPARAIRPTSFFMSPQHQMDVWDFVDLVSGYNSSDMLVDNPKNVVPTSVRESIFQTGAFANAWGYTFNWQLNSQIAKGRLYVFTDQPLGWMFTKSEFDRTIQYNESNSPRHMEYNYGEVMSKKALKFYVPDLWKHHIVIVDF